MKQENIELIRKYLTKYAGIYSELASEKKTEVEELEMKMQNGPDRDILPAALKVEYMMLSQYENGYAQHIEALAELDELIKQAE